MKLYLDIDQTINVDMPDPNWGHPIHDRKVHYNHGGGYSSIHPVRWAGRLITELSKVGLDLHWHTSWGSQAGSKFGRAIGWGQAAPHVCDQPAGKFDSSMDWKFAALQEVESPDARFVWLDNDLTDRERTAFPNALVIGVHPLLGVTVEDVERVIEFKRHHWDS